ncbi:MAG: hypothetical protein H0W73_09665 [Bacteroidetes bacterium]|nr:hypothetical protein [Bacteroidota bacterium]
MLFIKYQFQLTWLLPVDVFVKITLSILSIGFAGENSKSGLGDAYAPIGKVAVLEQPFASLKLAFTG